jgi:hypothetical protein
MKYFKLLLLLAFSFIITGELFAQIPNIDPKNPKGCAVQVQGTGGTLKRFHCIYCGTSFGTCVPNTPPCPYCWEAIERAGDPGVYDITLNLQGVTTHYVGTNVNFINLYDDEGNFIGVQIEFYEVP